MLKTLDEIKDVEIEAGVVINGVDNPNLASVDSTEPIKTSPDILDTADTGIVVVKTEEEKEEEEVKEKKKVEEEEDVVDDSSDEKNEEEKSDAKVKTEKKEEKVDDKLAVKPDDSKKVQKRIGTLTKNWRTAERERDFERTKRIELEEKLEELTSKIPVEGKPQKVDFDDEDDYIEALTDWKIDQKLQNSQTKKEEKVKESQEKDEMLETFDSLDEVLETGNDKYEDFEELILAKDLPITAITAQIALDTDNPVELLYFLANNPDEAKRIADLDPIRAGKEIGKLEIKLVKEEKEKEVKSNSEPEPEPKIKTKKQSKAPAPISSVRTDGVVDKDPNKMSPREYRAWRERKSK